MPLRTAEIVIKTEAFEKSMGILVKLFGAEAVGEHLGAIAKELIDASIAAPIPFDTGALSRSSVIDVEPTSGGVQVAFGFNIKYASIQDLGGGKTWFGEGRSDLPPKPYGSEKGPNLYFSETLRRAFPKILPSIATKIQASLFKAGK